MTSSFQLSRRPLRKNQQTNWSTYVRQGGVCPQGYDTIFFGTHDWKFCSPQRNSKGEGWLDGSGNEYAKECKTTPNGIDGVRTWSYTLYDPREDPIDMRETIPIETRRQLHEQRSYFDRYDYYRLPTRFNGTGYERMRSQGPLHKWPQYAEDNVDVPAVGDPHRFIQPYLAREQAKRGVERNWTTITPAWGNSVLGGFYGEAASFPQTYNREQALYPRTCGYNYREGRCGTYGGTAGYRNGVYNKYYLENELPDQRPPWLENESTT